MIGRYLALLSPEEEDRVLTTSMAPGDYRAPCLVGAVLGAGRDTTHEELRPLVIAELERQSSVTTADSTSVETRYDELCDRFGVERINALIRARVLRHRVQRALACPRARAQVAP